MFFISKPRDSICLKNKYRYRTPPGVFTFRTWKPYRGLHRYTWQKLSVYPSAQPTRYLYRLYLKNILVPTGVGKEGEINNVRQGNYGQSDKTAMVRLLIMIAAAKATGTLTSAERINNSYRKLRSPKQLFFPGHFSYWHIGDTFYYRPLAKISKFPFRFFSERVVPEPQYTRHCYFCRFRHKWTLDFACQKKVIYFFILKKHIAVAPGRGLGQNNFLFCRSSICNTFKNINLKKSNEKNIFDLYVISEVFGTGFRTNVSSLWAL